MNASTPLPPWLAADPPPSDRRGVARRMAGLVREWESAADRRAIFLSCYYMMTGNMLEALQAGRFVDAAWVQDLLERFSDYYFAALDGFDGSAQGAPAPWRLAFGAAQADECQVLQHLLLGVNAHINYDLVLCLSDVLQPEWDRLSVEQRSARYQDHCTVNAIIAATLDAVQDQVVERYAPFMALVDTACLRLDEWLITRLLAVWRERVWERAVQRVELSDDALREAHRLQVEEDALARGHLIRLNNLRAALDVLF